MKIKTIWETTKKITGFATILAGIYMLKFLFVTVVIGWAFLMKYAIENAWETTTIEALPLALKIGWIYPLYVLIFGLIIYLIDTIIKEIKKAKEKKSL